MQFFFEGVARLVCKLGESWGNGGRDSRSGGDDWWGSRGETSAFIGRKDASDRHG